ncbi:type II toxin-antitoxin system VapC family toxin [soil metagenome]
MSRLLLDTHVFMWWALASPRVKARWVDSIAEPSNTVAVSAATVWEIEIKKRSGKLHFPHEAIALAHGYGFELLPISPLDARRAGSLDWDHRDPFDRMLAAQCLERDFTLVTDDVAFFEAPGVTLL